MDNIHIIGVFKFLFYEYDVNFSAEMQNMEKWIIENRAPPLNFIKEYPENGIYSARAQN